VIQVPHKEVTARGLDSQDHGLLDAFVLSSESGEPVSSASLTLRRAVVDREEEIRFKTERRGRCRVEVEAGEYDMEVSGKGFETKSFSRIVINPGKTRKQDLNLPPKEPQPKQRPKVRKRTKECPDGTIIVTHVWQDGQWSPTNKKCPQDEEPECIDGEIRLALCPDGKVIVAEVCIHGEWHDTGAECDKDMPVDDEVLAEERSCSLRLRPGSVYLVDSLAAEIHDTFSESLQGSGLRKKYRQAFADMARGTVTKKGRALFNEVVEKVLEKRKIRGIGPTVPPELKGNVDVRGDLVLFRRPPILDRRPRASSRSLLRIEGDKLIEQIVNGANRVIIPTCARAGKGKSVTKDEIVAQLSAKSNVNKETVKLLLNALADLAVDELENKGEEAFRLPGFGTFRWKRLKGQAPRLIFDMITKMKKLKHPSDSQ
jgi:nucleoid DNA-binding protein